MRDQGYAVAAAMGLVAVRDAEGEDGTVYVLDGGRVLKITDSAAEAAVSLALRDVQARGRSHPSVPEIGGVWWLDDGSGPAADEETYYAILREDFADVDHPELDGVLWDRAVLRLRHAWQGRPPRIAAALSGIPDPYRTMALQAAEGLDWIRARTGCMVRDIRPGNIGTGPRGGVGMRDFSRADVPRHLMEAVGGRRFGSFPAVPGSTMAAMPP